MGPLLVLPPNLSNLANLTLLSITKTEIQSLPESIGKLSKLEKLFVFDNSLTHLPQSLVNCYNLGTIVAYDNKLTTFPGGWTSRNALYSLDVAWNRLTNLPRSMCNLKELRDLRVSENNLKCVFFPKGAGPEIRAEGNPLLTNALPAVRQTVKPKSLLETATLKILTSMDWQQLEPTDLPTTLFNHLKHSRLTQCDTPNCKEMFLDTGGVCEVKLVNDDMKFNPSVMPMEKLVCSYGCNSQNPGKHV